MLILTDNGSLSPASTLALRELAGKVSRLLGEPVAPVSLLHSSAIPPEHLDDIPAEILEPFLDKKLKEGVSRFTILPAFFGPSLALTDYLPKRVAALKKRFPELEVTIAPCLCHDEDGAGTIADLIARRIRARLAGLSRPVPVILVDHGSPEPAVTGVRDRIAMLLKRNLGNEITGLLAASMERRDGEAYAFNEPLLATALRTRGFDAGDVIVALQFLFPGRHAGPGGDIEAICEAAGKDRPSLRWLPTETAGPDDALAGLLCRRAREA